MPYILKFLKSHPVIKWHWGSYWCWVLRWVEGVSGSWWVTSRVSDTSGVHSSGDGSKCALKCRFTSHKDRNINMKFSTQKQMWLLLMWWEIWGPWTAAGSLLLPRGPWAMPPWEIQPDPGVCEGSSAGLQSSSVQVLTCIRENCSVHNRGPQRQQNICSPCVLPGYSSKKATHHPFLL